MPANIDIFKLYKKRVLLETGTFHGYGIECALAAGFELVISIELSMPLYLENRRRLLGNSKVKLFQGNSPDLIPIIMREINEPITIWLDAHFSGCDSAMGEKRNPILDELKAISRHPVKSHTIMIDDVRLFSTDEFDNIPIIRVIDILLEINPQYKIETVDSANFQNDILVASI